MSVFVVIATCPWTAPSVVGPYTDWADARDAGVELERRGYAVRVRPLSELDAVPLARHWSDTR